MPAVLLCDWNGRTSLEENDVIAVLPVRHKFARLELRLGVPVSEKVFAFIYCTDITPDGPLAKRLVAPTGGPVPSSMTGPYKHRRFNINLSALPGNTTRFTTHIPWGRDGSAVPNNHKYTWEQLRLRSRDKRPSGGRLPPRV